MNFIQDLSSVWYKLKCTNLPIILYGMGNGADKVLKEFEKLNIKAYGVMASDDFCRYQDYQGFTVKKLSDFEKELDDFIICLCFASSLPDVIENILTISNRHTLLVPNVPVFGDEILNDNFLSKYGNEIDKAYSLLADEKSKEVFENTIKFLYTGKIEYLLRIETDKSEAFENILKLNDNENYLDLGAYDGDTIKEFLSYVNDFDHITAVEPNTRNFRRLSENTKEISNISYVNKGISDSNKIMHISKDGGRMAYLSNEGLEIETISVDELLKDQKFTYIKADIEGMEKEMLEGAKKALAYKPKLCISAYHKTSDFFLLINMINDINCEYKIYLRKHKYIPCWDLNIYCK